MSPGRLQLVALLVLLAYSGYAAANTSSQDFDQIVYKGVVGNVLDGIPMDPSKRVSLQRTNAILSNTYSGHALGVLAGLSNPVLLIGGMVWGVWAASNIKPEDEVKTASGAGRAAAQNLVAVLDATTIENGGRTVQSDAGSAKFLPAAEAEGPPRVRAPVVKIWLPQRSSGAAVTQ